MIALLFVFSLFAVQLLRVQGIDAQSVSADALKSRLHTSTLAAQRGSIVDDSGVTLASSADRINVTDDPTATETYAKRINGEVRTVGLAGAATDIANAIGAEPQPILTAMQKAAKKKSRFTYLAKNITPAKWNRVLDLGIPGVSAEASSERSYPQGTALAPLLGWLGANGQAGGGVELLENKALKGTPGKHVYEQAPDGTVIATGDNEDTPAKDGKNVQLTIDSDLQWYSQNALASAVKKFGAESGEVVVMDTKQNLKAVASYPSFDNNNIASATGDLQSRAFTDAYEPGSTGKVVTMAALLQEGVATPTTKVTVPGLLKKAGTTFHDSEEHGTEHLTLAGVLAKSSNIGTIIEGSKLSSATMYSYMRKFGLGQTSAVHFPGESSGVLTPYKKWSETTANTVLFGQGVAASAIQEASIFATIANGGVKEPVKLVSGVGTNGEFTRTTTGSSTRVVSKKVATELTKMMEGVVSGDGTATAAKVSGYSVAGKTGTAERYSSTKGGYDGYTASFIGFAPASNPRYIVAVTLQKPSKGSIYGGEVAAPTFSKIMSYALKQAGVAPTGKQQTTYPQTFTTTNSREQD